MQSLNLGPIWQASDSLSPRALGSARRPFLKFCTRTAHSTHGDEPLVLDRSDKLASIPENSLLVTVALPCSSAEEEKLIKTGQYIHADRPSVIAFAREL